MGDPDPNPDDLVAAARYRLPRRRDQALAARALLRTALAATTGIASMTWRLEAGPHGAPVAAVAAGVRRAISLTHCRTVVACAIAERGPVGIDIEAIDPRRPITAITSAAFGPAERAAVECGGIETFYRIWTLREAYAKATGRGFAALVDGRDLPPIGVEADDTPAREHWCFASRRLPQGFWLGCAVLGEGGDVDEPEEV